MFAAPNIYSTTARYIDVADREFFRMCLDEAIEQFERGDLNTIVNDSVKKNYTPVVFTSSLSKLDKKSESVVSRKTLNTDRARRKFIMLDADFDKGEYEESELVRDNIITLAKELNTHVLIYPTVSYPEKPRFRAVMFTRRQLTPESYVQAMRWWFDNIFFTPNDEGDYRMSANRNAPVFTSQEQIDAIYSTLDDDDLQPLDSELWSSYPKPRKKSKPSDESKKRAGQTMKDMNIEFDERHLVEIAREELSEFITSYERCWPFINSLAKSVISGMISLDCAYDMARAIAESAPDESTREQWKADNVSMLDKSIQYLSDDHDRFDNARNLLFYKEFTPAIASVDNVSV